MLEKIEQKRYGIVVVDPPCNTFSRAQWANHLGPDPVRSRAHPRGFPWASGYNLDRAMKGNEYIDFALACLSAAAAASAVWIMIFPEDLGKAPLGWPASLWQAQGFRSIPGSVSFAASLRDFGAPTPFPLRMVASSDFVPGWAYGGWPTFDAGGRYLGPLPPPGRVARNLMRKMGDSSFRTNPAQAYPPAFCRAIAELLRTTFRKSRARMGLSQGISHPSGGQARTADEKACRKEVIADEKKCRRESL